ncbi:MAG: hypothetical protein JO354_00040 [Verrucomicrobia bacterium]|nr:hypothetical protein [Verrucomicrobiota bacterium]
MSFLTADPDAVLVTRVNNIVVSMTNNSNYPKPSPTLNMVTAANTAFSDAIAAAAEGGKQFTAAKNAKRAELVALLRQLANYIQGACAEDMAALLSSGFPVQKPDRSPASVPATPQTPRVSQGLRGQAVAVSSPVQYAYIYNWRVALLSDPARFVQQAQSTGARAAFTGLTPGQTYAIECNAVGTAGSSDWSNAGTLMVI